MWLTDHMTSSVLELISGRFRWIKLKMFLGHCCFVPAAFWYFRLVHFWHVSVVGIICFSNPEPGRFIYWIIYFFQPGKGDPDKGVKRSRGEMSGDCVRRRARPVSWPHGAVQDRREVSRHKLLVHGRLRGQRILLCRNRHFTSSTKGMWYVLTFDFV